MTASKVNDIRSALVNNNILDDKIGESLKRLEEIVEQRNIPTRGSFNWVDSELVHAIRNGDWIVLDNTNQSSDALLDRLNGLLEPNGELVINERGNIGKRIIIVLNSIS